MYRREGRAAWQLESWAATPRANVSRAADDERDGREADRAEDEEHDYGGHLERRGGQDGPERHAGHKTGVQCEALLEQQPRAGYVPQRPTPPQQHPTDEHRRDLYREVSAVHTWRANGSALPARASLAT